MSCDAPATGARVRCLPRRPECWSRNNPRRFKQELGSTVEVANLELEN